MNQYNLFWIMHPSTELGALSKRDGRWYLWRMLCRHLPIFKTVTIFFVWGGLWIQNSFCVIKKCALCIIIIISQNAVVVWKRPEFQACSFEKRARRHNRRPTSSFRLLQLLSSYRPFLSSRLLQVWPNSSDDVIDSFVWKSSFEREGFF